MLFPKPIIPLTTLLLSLNLALAQEAIPNDIPAVIARNAPDSAIPSAQMSPEIIARLEELRAAVKANAGELPERTIQAKTKRQEQNKDDAPEQNEDDGKEQKADDISGLMKTLAMVLDLMKDVNKDAKPESDPDTNEASPDPPTEHVLEPRHPIKPNRRPSFFESSSTPSAADMPWSATSALPAGSTDFAAGERQYIEAVLAAGMPVAVRDVHNDPLDVDDAAADEDGQPSNQHGKKTKRHDGNRGDGGAAAGYRGRGKSRTPVGGGGGGYNATGNGGVDGGSQGKRKGKEGSGHGKRADLGSKGGKEASIGGGGGGKGTSGLKASRRGWAGALRSREGKKV